jgi:BirA family biotin operon repressor/biotin-[acetyl-CoA-carboxylase] ligase
LPIGHPFVELGSVDSTNNYAMARVHAGTATHGTLFFGHEQWAGKGQRGKTWSSQPGENIVLSAVLEPVFLPITGQFLLSAAVALACHDLFSQYAGPVETAIKWPNDIYWRDRKAGGILIENSFRGDQWLAAIAGMGININQWEFPDTLQNPVSLKQITGKNFNAVALAKELGACLERRYEQLKAESKPSGPPSGSTAKTVPPYPPTGSIMTEYNACLYKRGQTIRLKKDGAIFGTKLQAVSANGDLLTGESADIPFRFGEVEWVLENR